MKSSTHEPAQSSTIIARTSSIERRFFIVARRRCDELVTEKACAAGSLGCIEQFLFKKQPNPDGTTLGCRWAPASLWLSRLARQCMIRAPSTRWIESMATAVRFIIIPGTQAALPQGPLSLYKNPGRHACIPGDCAMLSTRGLR